MGKVNTWNYQHNPGYWSGDCGQVVGSAGEFYPPGLNQTFIQLYSNDLCRSLKFNFTRDLDIKGIYSYEFEADKGLFANGSDNADNACYDSQDIPSGVFDVSACRFGAPVFISLPHFYLADPYYPAQIQSGISPNSSLHSTVFRIEPRSGVPTDVSARFQLNVLIEPISMISMTEKVRKTYFPVMWFENKAGVPDSLAFKMKLMANLPEILQAVGWIQIGVAISAGIISLIVFLARRKSSEDQCPILNQSHHEEVEDEGYDEDQ